jgi:SHS2 domain-containing protein
MDDKTMPKSFEILDHTADIGIIAYGTDIEQLFSNAALALFSLITNPEAIEEKLHFNVQVSSGDRDSLLVEWLNELIYFFDARHVLVHGCDIDSLTYNELKATCHGEDYEPAKHKIKREIKAATYHMLRLDKNSDGYRAQVILDV